MKTLFFAMTLVLCSFSFASESLVSTGEIYDKEGKKKLFLYERFQSKEGDTTVDRAVYKSLSGETLVEESLKTVNGETVRYDIHQKQQKKKAWVEVAKESVTFNLKKEGKPNFPKTIKRKENFVIGLQLVPFILKKWGFLMAGKKIPIKLGVWDRQEAIRFDLEKSEAKPGELSVRLRPSSMFVRAAVDPLYFIFDAKTKRLRRYIGRTAPMLGSGDNLKDFDAMTKFTPVAARKTEK